MNAARGSDLGRDLRALGVGAVPRAAYEVSKRVGGHSLLFAWLVPPRRPTPRLVSPFTVPSSVPDTVRERTAVEAGDIVAGKVRLFGRDVPVERRPDWSSRLDGDASWPSRRWWRIDIRSDARRSDVKWTWELGRHRHLVVLARAVALDPASPVLEHLEAQLTSWNEQCPPERGIHWYSNLEISLRAISWLQVLGLAGDHLSAGVRASMADALYHSGRHILADLPYTLSSMRNNHLLGDALGLVAIGGAFPGDRAARRWRRLGDAIFARQLRGMVRADGSTTEDSLSYHRFVTEMVAARILLGPAPGPLGQQLVALAQHLVRLGVLDGAVPQYGDWDEGRVLVGGDPIDLSGSVRIALALGGTGAPDEWRRAHDDVAWYCAEGDPCVPDAVEERGADVGGGIARARVGEVAAWLKAGSGPSHGHADLCSASIAWDRSWVVGDPGTGSYNGPVAQRGYFRSSSAHDVVRVDGMEQMEAHRSFRWLSQPAGHVGPPLRWAGGVVMWGWHDAYCRLDPPRRLARAVMLSEEGVAVGDWVEGGPCECRLALPLAPGARWHGDGVLGVGEKDLRLHLEGTVRSYTGQLDPYRGWWSSTYGAAEPATVVECTRVVSGEPLAWSLSTGRPPPPPRDGAFLVHGEARVAVEFQAGLVALTLRAAGTQQTALSGRA